MVPDKIYIGTVTLSSNAPSEEHLLPDWHLRPNPKIANIEYIRKDKIREMVMYARNMSQTPDAAIHNWDVLIKEIDKL